jgi:hypothetical protein
MIGIGLELFFSWAVLYTPTMNNIMGTGPVTHDVYALACSGMFIIFGFDYLRKKIAQRIDTSRFMRSGGSTPGSNGASAQSY